MAQLGSKGLGNVGNTCGLNALLQCIAHTHLLREFVLKKSTPDGLVLSDAKFSIVNELKRLMREFWIADVSIVPRRFAKAFEESMSGRITMGEQMDMSEVFHVLLENFEKEWENEAGAATPPWKVKTGANATTPQFRVMCDLAHDAWMRFMAKVPNGWSHLMNGLQVGQVVCENCNHVYHNFEPFSALSLEVPRPPKGESVQLGDCFKQYLEPEKLEGGWKCDKCGACKAEKLTRFWSAPNVLVIVLKRFRYRSDGRLEKVHVPVNIPETFKFLPGTELSGESKTYHIRAIGCHFGSLNSGHYTALAPYANKWHHFDDLSVSPIENADMALKNNIHAYMLFYEKMC
jgi:ubiquitin carboxyl-terminal hydrolase 8